MALAAQATLRSQCLCPKSMDGKRNWKKRKSKSRKMCSGRKGGALSIFATQRETVLSLLRLSFGEWRKAAVPQLTHEPTRRILHRLGGQGRAGHRQNGAQGRRHC